MAQQYPNHDDSHGNMQEHGVQHTTVQHTTVEHTTVQHSTMQRDTMQHDRCSVNSRAITKWRRSMN